MRKAENDRNRCVACGLCALQCPKQAIEIRLGCYALVHREMCVGCGACERACPTGSIKVETVKETEGSGVL